MSMMGSIVNIQIDLKVVFLLNTGVCINRKYSVDGIVTGLAASFSLCCKLLRQKMDPRSF